MTKQVLTPATGEPELQSLLAAHGGCIEASQVVSLLGLKDASIIDQWRERRQIVAVRTQVDHWAFPLWQFAPKHKRVMLGIRDCLAELPFAHEGEPIVFF